MRKFVFGLVFVLLAGLVAGVYYFHFQIKPEIARAAIAAMPRPAAGVAVEAARAETWAPHVSAIGTFKSVPGIDVSSQVAGIVAAIAFKNGQDVEKGALLVKLDDSTEQADLRTNKAQMKNAQQAFDRQKMLQASGVAARANFDLAQALRDQAAGAEDKTLALIGQKTITAPFAGRLGIRKVDVGQYVAAGSPMVSLQRLDPIYLDFPAPEQDYPNLYIGQEVSARLDAFPGTRFKGKVSNIDARVDPTTRAILVRAEFANPDKKILPGMFGHVDFEAGKPARVVTAPRTSVAFSLYGDSVFVVRPDDKQKGFDGPLHVERRSVKVGDAQGDRIVLLAGVEPGEKVVTEGQIKLQPGAHVRIEPDAAMTPPAVRPMP
ncbi:efflux RND transporter periplasmic adaptor subunit [Rhodoblastus acidophilus]|uniref:Efflux RND transporter periplasmic adaptor subunit n=1 Tax=Candidatus Rhodoblastus alkanivorans TaxID=2954117 RepID=A0ABS9Z7G2_9HYPH|nr:efflux RND transporter periplasmic adaptor subunit [Candidatus Rhodoblastus alkanivorans]MCI4677656.1 efflux RND transporter periplasmic adaptor subunit [Candidatus Rhodoblastus alkanivorans]MCI4682612.1 efflux RND transporter periplasmic adaptor subunit [Candidatus Rhodoblastus alkanivorans]MDI4639918.1 efflux RND transporter periplasmic adaptor subunit [Rhodoblastus acidophilus]